MGEIWGAAIAVGGSIINGIAASKKAKQDRENAKEDTKEMTENDARFGAIASQFNAEQDYYYEQLKRKNKQRGLDQFRQFSTVNQFAPNFVGGNTTITLPAKPDINALIKANAPPAATTTTAATPEKKSTAKKLFGIIDPGLSKLLGF